MSVRTIPLAADVMAHGINLNAALFAAAVIGGILLLASGLSRLFGGK